MIEVHETQGVGVRCVTGGLRCVAGAGAARAPGGGARPGFATRLPAPAHTVPRRESGLCTAGLCCGCHALDGTRRPSAAPGRPPGRALCPVAALARGLQIPVRRRENAAAVLRVAATGPAGRGRGEQGQDAVRTWLDSVQGGLSPPGGDPGGPGAA